MKLIFDKLEHDTDEAYLLRFGDQKEWVPKSKAEILNEDTRGPEYGGEVEIPRWLVEKKGLEGYEA